ncbi:hypothetical protein C8J57DRAFT_1243831 [Mycena rebaudengoi]|nr:hypothetical protein C8J57DRAFT_1243831 [Mycena rebaudengoi]
MHSLHLNFTVIPLIFRGTYSDTYSKLDQQRKMKRFHSELSEHQAQGQIRPDSPIQILAFSTEYFSGLQNDVKFQNGAITRAGRPGGGIYAQKAVQSRIVTPAIKGHACGEGARVGDGIRHWNQPLEKKSGTEGRQVKDSDTFNERATSGSPNCQDEQIMVWLPVCIYIYGTKQDAASAAMQGQTLCPPLTAILSLDHNYVY